MYFSAWTQLSLSAPLNCWEGALQLGEICLRAGIERSSIICIGRRGTRGLACDLVVADIDLSLLMHDQELVLTV